MSDNPTTSRLDKLVKDVEQMSTEELLELTRAIRADRRVSKRIVRHTTKTSRDKASTSIKDLLAGLDPEVRKALLEQLKG